jgi:hypothetical protein
MCTSTPTIVSDTLLPPVALLGLHTVWRMWIAALWLTASRHWKHGKKLTRKQVVVIVDWLLQHPCPWKLVKNANSWFPSQKLYTQQNIGILFVCNMVSLYSLGCLNFPSAGIVSVCHQSTSMLCFNQFSMWFWCYFSWELLIKRKSWIYCWKTQILPGPSPTGCIATDRLCPSEQSSPSVLNDGTCCLSLLPNNYGDPFQF